MTTTIKTATAVSENKIKALNVVLGILETKEATRVASLSKDRTTVPTEYYIENEMITDQWDNIHFDLNNEELVHWFQCELIETGCLIKHSIAGDFYYDFE